MEVTALNGDMKFLLHFEYITEDRFFQVKVKFTLEQKKRQKSSRSRTDETYTLDEVLELKKRIDATYANDPKMKLRAYVCLLGVGTGLRVGNILGLKNEHLHPEAEVPYLETGDNVVNGWSRGISGKVILENATKTFVGSVPLPLLQPSVSILQEVVQYIKDHTAPGEYIINCYPGSLGKFWRKIAVDCCFKYLHPHSWKHSYATIGALHLHDWYGGNPYNLQKYCLHSEYKMTEKYIRQDPTSFLKGFKLKK